MPMTAARRVKLATGTLATVDNQIDPTTGTVKMRAQFDNTKGELFPNQFVNVRLLVNTLHNQTLVPASAISAARRAPSSSSCSPTRRSHAHRDAWAARTATKSRSLKGLKPGDTVVIDGADRLRDGAEVIAAERARSAGRQAQRPPARRRHAMPRAARARQDGGGDQASSAAPTSKKYCAKLHDRRATCSCALRREPRQLQRHLPGRAARNFAAGGDGGGGGRRRRAVTAGRGEQQRMNPSAPFIQRPVATSLLMIAILLVGLVGYLYLPLSALPEVDYPTIQVQTFLPGASPEVMTTIGHRAAGTPVRPDAGPEPDVVGQFGRRLGRHAAIRSQPQPRHRRAGGAGGDQCRRAICCRRACPRRRSTPRSIRPTRRS